MPPIRIFNLSSQALKNPSFSTSSPASNGYSIGAMEGLSQRASRPAPLDNRRIQRLRILRFHMNGVFFHFRNRQQKRRPKTRGTFLLSPSTRAPLPLFPRLSCIFWKTRKPQSSRRPDSFARSSLLSIPFKTSTTRRPSRVPDAINPYPPDSVWPVLSPSAPMFLYKRGCGFPAGCCYR